MIPILYEANETAFTSNGLGRLSDAITCTVTEEVNGAYELKMEYPLDGRHVDDIEVNKIIYAVPSVGKHAQPFRIREINKSLGNRIQITARHFCYELSFYAVSEFGLAGRVAYNVTPILYNSSDHVIGRLTDLTSKTVRKDISANKYYMTIVYPNSGQYANDFVVGCKIFCQAEVGKNPQTFFITAVTSGSSSKTISSYAPILTDYGGLNQNTVLEALERVHSHVLDSSFPFTFEAVPYDEYGDWRLTDHEWWNEFPKSARELLMDGDNMIINTYGGEWEWDHYNCLLHERRGEDNGVTYTYGKNITDISSVTNIDEFYTYAFSYWKGTVSSSTESTSPDNEYTEYHTERGTILKVSDDAYDAMFPYKKTLIIDASSEFDEAPTTAQLDDYTNWYVKQNDIGIPRATIHVDVVDLASTEEYKNYIPLETVHLCDYVTVIFPLFGVNVKEQIQKIEYNVLTGKNNAVTIGDTKLTLADAISSNKKNIRKTMYNNREWADRCAERAIRASSGWYGGNLLKKYNPQDHKQQEAYVMDQDKEDNAEHVLKADKDGISASTTGTSGTYNALVALRNPRDTIGVNGTMVNFGKLKTNAVSSGTLSTKQSSWDLDTGEAKMFLQQLAVSADNSLTDGDFAGFVAIVKDFMKIIAALGIGEVTTSEMENYKLYVKGDGKITGRFMIGTTDVGDTLGQIDGLSGSISQINDWIADLDRRVTDLGG